MKLSNLLAVSNTARPNGDKRWESKAARKAIATAIKNPMVITPEMIADADADVEPNVVFEFDNGRTGYNINSAINRADDKLVDLAKEAGVTLVSSYKEGATLGSCINHVSSDENYKALTKSEQSFVRAFAKDDPAYKAHLESLDIAYTAENVGTLEIHAYIIETELLSDDEANAEDGVIDSDESAE